MVQEDIGNKIPLIIDGGKCSTGLESTILDITKLPYVILRHGGISQEAIEDVLQCKVCVNKNEHCIKAPGMTRKHYSPSIPIRMNAKKPNVGEAFIAFGQTHEEHVINLSREGNLEEAAHNLFSIIKSCDDKQRFCGIAVAPIPNYGIGAAINDRLKRASYKPRKVLLVILDGFGVSDQVLSQGDATQEAKSIQRLFERYPSSLLDASGKSVGLSPEQFGNSEVGHLTIGAGRIIKQKLPMISDSIKNGEFCRNEKLLDFLKNTKVCHIMGLFSDGGVHSHITHFLYCIELLRNHDIVVKSHLFLDGRDVARDAALKTLAGAIDEKRIFLREIATVHGRYYAMDRDNKWDRTNASYEAIKNASSQHQGVCDPVALIDRFYQSELYDENIPPFVMNGYNGIVASDSVWMLNFRQDRIKQILSLFQRDNIRVLNMVDLFNHQILENSLGEVIAMHGLKQFRIAETEKYAHVTYFMNGGREKVFPDEHRVLVPSPKVQNYENTPSMSSHKITEQLLNSLSTQEYDLVIVNYASPDMIGHTGNLDVTKKAITILDEQIAEIVNFSQSLGYDILITSDHGNAEKMINEDGSPCKTHTTSKVPFVYISDNTDVFVRNGSLQDVAPTILYLLDIDKPNGMTGSSLVTLL
jgi:2,3-bisphosphoglycerate-independent phosphoglycerate mutase